MHQNLVLEDPLVPDVDTGVAPGRAGDVRGEVLRQRGGEEQRQQEVRQQGRCMPGRRVRALSRGRVPRSGRGRLMSTGRSFCALLHKNSV